MAQPQLSVVTLGIGNLERSKRFYGEGFGWKPAFENGEIAFYRLNGLILGTWLRDRLGSDAARPMSTSDGFALAHNVPSQEEVEPMMARLEEYGGTIMRPADAPAHGGFRGYVADPDGHPWEIAHNPAWSIGLEGQIRFGV